MNQELGMAETLAALETIRGGDMIAVAMPALEEVIYRLETVVDRTAILALDAGELTPETALYAWQEKAILRKLLRRLTQLVKTGKSAGETIETQMEI